MAPKSLPVAFLLRYWRTLLGSALVLWVLGTAWSLARRHGRREIVAGIPAAALGLLLFLFVSFTPRPPLTESAAADLLVISIALLAAGFAMVVWSGFRPAR